MKHSTTLSRLEQEQTSISQRLETLYGKQGRGQQFTSEKQRNIFLQEQVKTLRTQLVAKENLFQRLSTEVQEEAQSLNQEGAKQKAGEQVSRQHNGKLEELATRAKTLLEKRNTAQEVSFTLCVVFFVLYQYVPRYASGDML